jgi:hypothetical protein
MVNIIYGLRDPRNDVYQYIGRINIKTDYKTYKMILGELYNSRLRPDLNHLVVKEPEVVVDMGS